MQKTFCLMIVFAALFPPHPARGDTLRLRDGSVLTGDVSRLSSTTLMVLEGTRYRAVPIEQIHAAEAARFADVPPHRPPSPAIPDDAGAPVDSPMQETTAPPAPAPPGNDTEDAEFKAISKSLYDPDPVVQEEAVRAMGRRGEEKIVALSEMIRTSTNNQNRGIAMYLLAATRDPRVLAPLSAVLADDENDGMRKFAARSLGVLGHADAGPGLCRAMESDKSIEVRMEAAEAAGTLRSPDVIEPLTRLLGDADPRLRESAAVGLCLLSFQLPQAMNRGATVRALIRALDDESHGTRESSVEALGKIGNPAAVDAVIRTLKRCRRHEPADRHLYLLSLESLGNLKDPRAVPVLEKHLSRDVEAAEYAVEALGQIGSPRAVPRLIPLLKRRSSMLRSAVADALARIGDPAAGPPLLHLLQRAVEQEPSAMSVLLHGEPPNEYEMCSVIRALGLLRHGEAVPVLIGVVEMGDDHGRGLRKEAALALAEIGDRRAVSPLRKLVMEDDSVDTQAAAAQALGRLGDPRALEQLRAVVRRRFVHGLVKEAATESIRRLESGP